MGVSKARAMGRGVKNEMFCILFLMLAVSCGDEPVEFVAPSSWETWLAVGQSNMVSSAVSSSFVKSMREKGIVVNVFLAAIDSTPISCWMKGGDCYEEKILPYVHEHVDGVFYWQGETEALGYEDLNDSAEVYGENFVQLIQEYREDFGDVPFVYVVLQNYFVEDGIEPGLWAECREEQSEALQLPDVYGVETRDITNGDVHPVGAYDEIGSRAAEIASLL